MGTIVRSKAPLRISFAGGGTDVPPYPQERGGAVLSVTINKYAYASLLPTEDGAITVQSLDYDVVAKYHTEADLAYNGELDLVKAVIRRLAVEKRGLRLFLHSDAPPGSGLGSSSTLVVALVGLFRHWLRQPLTDYQIAELAYQIERVDLGVKGGMQDQYAATFGGVNFIEFYDKAVIVNPLRVSAERLNELEYNLLLCYTGRTRLSANIVARQTESFIQKKEEVVRALDAQKEMAIQMKNALLQGHLDVFGHLLHEAWQTKKHLDPAITTPQIDEMYESARREGASGGKILGAGGGGYLLLYCPFDRKHVVAAVLEQLGGQIVEFGIESRGLQTWEP
jgi:D-glycero-alpha-D-manno-heptose-7-phosphate kinase